jgi:hypothetical protein
MMNQLLVVENENRRTVIDNLQQSHAQIDVLIRRCHQLRDYQNAGVLRRIRVELGNQLEELQDMSPDAFDRGSDDNVTLDSFYRREDEFTANSGDLLREVRRQSAGDIDPPTLSDLVGLGRETFRARIPIIAVIADEVRRNDIDQEMGSTELPEEVSGRLYHYLNSLEQKYATHHPEISHTGDWLASMSWDYTRYEDRISGRIKEGILKTPLTIEARWQPSAEIQQIQSEADSIGRKQYKCLCLINRTWDDAIKDWIRNFTHQRASLYLYELEGDLLIHNSNNPAAECYACWFSPLNPEETVLERILMFIDEHEYFATDDLCSAFHLSEIGASMVIYELLDSDRIVDVSSSMYGERYTKMRV